VLLFFLGFVLRVIFVNKEKCRDLPVLNLLVFDKQTNKQLAQIKMPLWSKVSMDVSSLPCGLLHNVE
jgi:hypothetical protein